MHDTKKLTRFQVLPSSDGSDPQLVIELEDGSKLSLTASFEQIEDMADLLDELLDSTEPGDEDDTKRLPAFVRRSSPDR